MVNSDENKLRLRKLETELSDVKFELEDAKNQLSEERKKRQFYQLVADFTFGWEIWLEPGGKIKYCSPSCYDLTGFTSNQIVSTQDISNLLVYETDIQTFNNFLASSIDQMLVHQSLEFRILTRTKQLRWCFMNIRGVYDKFGKYMGVRASIQDVTRLKRAMGSIKDLEAGKEYQNRSRNRLQTELELKDRELVSFLLQLSQKNELITKGYNLIKEVKPENPKRIQSQIEQLVELFRDSSLSILDWTVIENQLEKLHPGFFQRLLQKHPLISLKDRKLCAYIRIGLSSKDIAGLQNMTSKSVEIARVRLRKKLKLSHEIRLLNYLLQL